MLFGQHGVVTQFRFFPYAPGPFCARTHSTHARARKHVLWVGRLT